MMTPTAWIVTITALYLTGLTVNAVLAGRDARRIHVLRAQVRHLREQIGLSNASAHRWFRAFWAERERSRSLRARIAELELLEPDARQTRDRRERDRQRKQEQRQAIAAQKDVWEPR